MKKRIFATLLALVMALGLCVTTAWAEGEITYLDADGTTRLLTKTCTEISESNKPTAWGAGWHVVKGDVTINDQVTIIGDAKLILYDGATLTVNGDTENAIMISSGSLTVYGQANQSGTLHAKCNAGCSIVANPGSLIVNSGKVTARSDGSVSGIGGNVTIAGGTVIAYRGIDGSVTLPTCYKWRTAEDGAFIKNSVEAYSYDHNRTYVEIVACHDFGTWVTEIPATCTKDGTVGHKTCATCNKNFDSNGVEISDLTIPTINHRLTHVDARAATRQEAGNIEYWQCSNCQQCFADENGQTPIAQADTVIAKLPPKNNNNNNSTPTTATTETVASPKTADAGVLLSGALALTSLLGMGYVGKKR